MVDDLLTISTCGQNTLALNTYINAQIELKKLEFHTPDIKGKSKCHKMHVGKPSKTCPQLQVHGKPIHDVSHDVYLGDVISSNGKNEENLKRRIGRGLGKIKDIMTILENVTFGEHYFSTAVLLRESLFLSSVLSSADIWYNLSTTDIKQLEDLDFRKILCAPISVPVEALYLELGVLNIETLVKIKRVNYLQDLVKTNPEEMLHKFF